MSAGEPTPEEAASSLAAVARANVQVRTSDRLFAVRLLALAAAVVGCSLVIVVFGLLPKWTGPLQGVLAGLALAGAAVLVVGAQMRQHVYSRAGHRWFTGTLVVFAIWGAEVLQWSSRTDWISSQHEWFTRAWHFVLMALVAVVPLLLGALVIGRRR